MARQLDVWAARVPAMPLTFSTALFGPFCSNGSGAASPAGGEQQQQQQVPSLLAAAASDSVQALPLLAAIVGDAKAGEAAAKLCGAVAVNVANGTAGSEWGSRVDAALAGAASGVKVAAAKTAVAVQQAAAATAVAAKSAGAALKGASGNVAGALASAQAGVARLRARLPGSKWWAPAPPVVVEQDGWR